MPKKHMHIDRARSALLSKIVGSCLALGALALPPTVHADPFIGEVICGGWNFCPVGWLDCKGQTLAISEYDTLFQLIGTTYGGDGQSNFAVPNIQSRTVVGDGSGPGLTTRIQGETGGQETVALTTNQLPIHNHNLMAHGGAERSASPTGNVLGVSPASAKAYSSTATNVALRPSAMSLVGGSQPHDNIQPYLAVKCCIAYQGIFPASQ